MNEHHIFETPLGWIGIVWSDGAITRLFMPDTTRTVIEQRIARYGDSSPAPDLPPIVSDAVNRIGSYLAGEPVDFSDIPVSAGDVGPMREAIYAVLREVPHGETLTYGELAARAGYPGMAREIGEAMGKNPVPIIVPCHRVLAAGGKIGGFSAPGGAHTKEKLLALEGVSLSSPLPAQTSFTF